MKNWRVYVLLLIAGIVILGGCGSTSTVETPLPEPPPQEAPRPQPQPQPPPPLPPEPVDTGPSRAALDALDAAIARAEKERRQAADFGASSYFPGDWESAEAGFGAIRADRSSPEGVAEAEGLYNEAADRYNEIFRRSLALYIRDLEEELRQARAEALAAGIDELAPEYLAMADRDADAARDRFTAEDYYAADKAAREALDRYRSLTLGAEAYKIREEVLQRDFAGFDGGNFKRGDDALNAAADAYEGAALKDALSAAAEAKLRYDTVLKAGWAAYAAQLRALAAKERQNAINAKADVAVKDDFAGIERVFTQAEAAYRAASYEETVPLYIRSEAGFVALAQAAEEKRRIAQAAIDAAEKKLEESDATAREAEGILEGDEE
jgi:hypothetical protein